MLLLFAFLFSSHLSDSGFDSCASSKHLQTRRFLDTLQSYLWDVQRVLIQVHRSANERPAPFVDHLGILRDSKTGRPINGYLSDEGEELEEIVMRECLFPTPRLHFF
jgi:carnitine O-acetyltransferase